MATENNPKNKMVGNTPIKQAYFFAGDADFAAMTIYADSMEDAQAQYAELRKKSTAPAKPDLESKVE
jgi:hypothetical protein